jgi:secreted PhoX family phosphatase
VNVPTDFEMPDNLTLDKNGNLYICEDPGSDYAHGKRKGDDIWVAVPDQAGNTGMAKTTVRFATLTDSEAEPTGIYFDKSGTTLFVNIQHRGGDGLDKTLAITKK